jgi:hypothetical protein
VVVPHILTLATAAMPGRNLGRVSMINWVARRDIGDTDPHSGDCALEVRDESGRRLDLAAIGRAGGVDLSRPRRLSLVVPPGCDLGDRGLLVFRLFDAEGRSLPPLPLMREGPSSAAGRDDVTDE